MIADTQTLIEQAYSAFNKRDSDGALALMTIRKVAKLIDTPQFANCG
jgi:hypothetical protein